MNKLNKRDQHRSDNNEIEGQPDVSDERFRKFSDKMLFHLSHRLRGPLSSILGLVEVIDKNMLTHENKELIGHIGEKGKELEYEMSRMQQIIQGFYDQPDHK